MNQHSDFHALLRSPDGAMVTDAPRRLDGSRRQRWVARAVVTAAAWLVSFVVVLAAFTLFGDQLEALPLAWSAFVVSGVLVNLMANLVMPVLIVAVGRLLGRPTAPPFGRGIDAVNDEWGASS